MNINWRTLIAYVGMMLFGLVFWAIIITCIIKLLFN
mgnify:CR=1 FL=1